MKENSEKIRLLPDGDIQSKIQEEIPYLEWLDAMNISREKRKKISAFLNETPVINNGIVLHPGDTIRLHVEPDWDGKEISYEPVEVVYEDDWCLVANKPSYLLVHSDGTGADSLSARVNGHLLSEGAIYPGQAAGRIDFEAQGLVLFGKHPLAQSMLDEQVAGKKMVKEYLAVIDGTMAKKHIDLNNPIARDRHDARKMIVYTGGKPAHTHVETLKTGKGRSLLKATIDTGRKHQIRVHLAHNGHPIVNDPLYSTREPDGPLMLQCHRLVFTRPFSNDTIEVEADFPENFRPFRRL